MNVDTRTHENKDAISIFLPAFDHLVIFILCHVGVYGEELPRAVTEGRFRLIRCRPRVVAVAICYRHYEIGEVRPNLRVIHTWVVPHLGVSVDSLRHWRDVRCVVFRRETSVLYSNAHLCWETRCYGLYGWADNTDIPLLCLAIILAGDWPVSVVWPTVHGAYCKSMGVCKLASFLRTLVFITKALRIFCMLCNA